MLIPGPTARDIVHCAFIVRRDLGVGLFEHIYERCLAHELSKRGHRVARQVPVPVVYDGIDLGFGFRADLVVNDEVLVEIKVVERLMPIHRSQVLTYLRCTGLTKGLLLNFNTALFKDGIWSVVRTPGLASV